MSKSHKVVVIGGGYAGAIAANRLRARADVTVVNPRPTFVDRIRLHRFAAGTGEAAVDYGTLLGEGVRLAVDSATRIDPAARVVELASGRALDYDYVVYAVGSTGAVPADVPGAAEHAWSLAEFETARWLRTRLGELPPDAPITVVGGGLTGVEIAAELAERGRPVTLVCGGTLAPSLSTPARRAMAGWLSRHGVEVVEGAAVTEVRSDAVVLGGGVARSGAVAGVRAEELVAGGVARSDELVAGGVVRPEVVAEPRSDELVAGGVARSGAVAGVRADELVADYVVRSGAVAGVPSDELVPGGGVVRPEVVVEPRADELVAVARSGAVVAGGGVVRESALTIWAAGFGVPGLAVASGLRTDELGRLLTDETLTSVDDDRIVAAGDAAAPSGRPLRMSCQIAAPLGAHAADTVLHRIAGTRPAALDVAFVGSCVSLGRRAGVRQFARKDDTSTNLYFGGRLGAAYKELTYKLGVLKIRREARKPGSLIWAKGGRPVA